MSVAAAWANGYRPRIPAKFVPNRSLTSGGCIAWTLLTNSLAQSWDAPAPRMTTSRRGNVSFYLNFPSLRRDRLSRGQSTAAPALNCQLRSVGEPRCDRLAPSADSQVGRGPALDSRRAPQHFVWAASRTPGLRARLAFERQRNARAEQDIGQRKESRSTRGSYAAIGAPLERRRRTETM